MERIIHLLKMHAYYTAMINRLERLQKKTPGNGYAIMKCREHIDAIEKELDHIDYMVQAVYD